MGFVISLGFVVAGAYLYLTGKVIEACVVLGLSLAVDMAASLRLIVKEIRRGRL